LEKALYSDIESEKRLSEWLEEGIGEKAAREESKQKQPKWKKTCSRSLFERMK